MSAAATEAALLAADAAARERALEPAASFIVEAPAGAGKTELLTQRYLRLLATVAEPEEIVAITFTNKAAAEMRARILDSLAAARSGVVPQAAHKRITFELSRAALAASGQRGWALEANPARLRIMTIDALCASLARQMPVLSQFGAPPNVTDDALGHYREAVRRTLAMVDDGEEGDAAAEVVAAALRHLDNDAQALGRLLVAMLARRDQWLRHALAPATDSERGLRLLVARDLAQLATCFDAGMQASLMPLARYAAANLAPDAPIAALAQWQTPLAGDPDELPLWRGLRCLLLTGEGELRRAIDKRIGFPAGKDGKPFKDAMLEALAALRIDARALARVDALPDPRYTAEEWQTLDALATLLRLAAAQLWTVFHAARETDFVEVAQRALAALGDADAPSELALRLDYRVQHLLVDEFQDTSPAQIELLRRLTAGWTPGDGRTLFAVGDPMQSIYRFRKADVGLFLRAADAGIAGLPLERLRLARNNRSCAKVVAWVNLAFAQVFPPRDSATAGAIAYRPFAATRDDPPDAGVFVHPIVVEREQRGQGSALEARRVLEVIDAERAADPRRSIAVLVRARHHLAALVSEIRRCRPDVRFSAVETEALSERQCVQDLLALTRALLHRADRVNWLAILRAPWCGLTLADLHALAADDHEATLWSLMTDAARLARLSEDGRARLAHLRAAVGEALSQQGRQPLARWIEGAWLALGGAACLRTPGEAADVRAYLDLLADLEAAGRFSLDRIEDEAAELYAAPDAAADGRLQFMTIHKAKGLEFDTVILPGLHRKARGDDAPLIRWEEVALEGLDECLVAAPVRRKGARRDGPPSPFDYIGLLERERAANEAERVLYVGVTRAVRALHLVGVAQRAADGGAAAPAGTFLASLWTTVEPAFAAAAQAVAAVAAPDATPFLPKFARLATPAAPAFLRARGKPAAADMPLASAPASGAPGSRLDAAVGTLVHAYLEAIARTGPDAWPERRVRQLAPAMRAWFGRRGHGEADSRAGAQRAEAALLTTLGSEAGRWVLAPRAGAAAELAVGSRSAGGIAMHVVDRCFIDAGMRWIVDYKTTPLADDAAMLSAQAEIHRPQLERYARLFADEGLPVRMGVFFAATGRLIELAATLA